MKKHKKSIIGVVLMVLITLGVYILFKGDGNSVFTGDDTTQAMEFNDINLNEEKDGKVIWKIRKSMFWEQNIFSCFAQRKKTQS